MAENNKIRDITFILKDLLKVIKVVTLYPEDNPLPASLRRSFSEKLESLVEDYGEMAFSVDTDTLTYEKNSSAQLFRAALPDGPGTYHQLVPFL